MPASRPMAMKVIGKDSDDEVLVKKANRATVTVPIATITVTQIDGNLLNLAINGQPPKHRAVNIENRI